MSYNWGYSAGKKLAGEMGFATGGKVSVKAHTRMPRVAKPAAVSLPSGKPNIKESITKSVKMTPAAPMPAMKKGGKVARHDDAAEDAKQIKGMVKSDCLKKAAGGSVKTTGNTDKLGGVNTVGAIKEKPYNCGGKVKGMKDGGNFIAKAIKHPGALHKTLGVPAGEKIPAAKLAKAAHSSNPTTRKRAALAKTLKSFHK